MTEIIVNTQLAALLQDHGVQIQQDGEFVNTDLTDKLKFKARAVYHEINNGISSQLDVTKTRFISVTSNEFSEG